MLQSMGSQTVGHDGVTKQQQIGTARKGEKETERERENEYGRKGIT